MRDFMLVYVFPLIILLRTCGTALTELCLLGNETQMPCRSNWLWEQPIAAFIVINRIT